MLLSKGDKFFIQSLFIANEVIDSKLKSGSDGILCKLDIQKAYNHVNWNFLLAVLDKMGFGHKWIWWINWCISTPKFSILINGNPTGFFHNPRGLRQGYPISLFICFNYGGS